MSLNYQELIDTIETNPSGVREALELVKRQLAAYPDATEAELADALALFKADGSGATERVDVETLLSRLSVENFTELQSFNPNVAGNVYVLGRTTKGDGGEGHFRWDSSDLSTEVANDEVTTGEGDGGIYVAPDSDKTGASGAWVRQLREGGKINAAAYGVFTTNTGDENRDRITNGTKSAVLHGAPVFVLGAGTYPFDGYIAVADGATLIGRGVYSTVLRLIDNSSAVDNNEHTGIGTVDNAEWVGFDQLTVDSNSQNNDDNLPSGYDNIKSNGFNFEPQSVECPVQVWCGTVRAINSLRNGFLAGRNTTTDVQTKAHVNTLYVENSVADHLVYASGGIVTINTCYCKGHWRGSAIDGYSYHVDNLFFEGDDLSVNPKESSKGWVTQSLVGARNPFQPGIPSCFIGNMQVTDFQPDKMTTSNQREFISTTGGLYIGYLGVWYTGVSSASGADNVDTMLNLDGLTSAVDRYSANWVIESAQITDAPDSFVAMAPRPNDDLYRSSGRIGVLDIQYLNAPGSATESRALFDISGGLENLVVDHVHTKNGRPKLLNFPNSFLRRGIRFGNVHLENAESEPVSVGSDLKSPYNDVTISYIRVDTFTGTPENIVNAESAPHPVRVYNIINKNKYISGAGPLSDSGYSEGSPDIGAVSYNIAPASGGHIGWVIVDRNDTLVRTDFTSGTTLEVDSTSGMAAGDVLGVERDNGFWHWTTIASITDSDTLEMTDSLGDSAATGNTVITFRQKTFGDIT